MLRPHALQSDMCPHSLCERSPPAAPHPLHAAGGSAFFAEAEAEALPPAPPAGPAAPAAPPAAAPPGSCLTGGLAAPASGNDCAGRPADGYDAMSRCWRR
ncbi:unnamed protein product [Closterium sp. NIES-53]